MRLLRKAVQESGMKAPEIVTPKSTQLVLKVFNEYVDSHSDDPSKVKTIHAVSCMIIALRWVYLHDGHCYSWTISMNKDRMDKAHRNPLTSSYMIQKFRRILPKDVASLEKSLYS